MLSAYLFSLKAFAENPSAPSGAPAPGPASMLTSFAPMLIIFGIFYFLVIRPQQRKQKDQQKFISELKKGSRVITSSGIIGIIRNLDEKTVTLEIDENTTLKLLRSQITESADSLYRSQEPAKA